MSSDAAPLHAALSSVEGIHGIIAGTIADEAAMVAGTISGDPTGTRTVDAQDVSSGKLFLRSDIGALVRFTSASPVRWASIGNPPISSAVAAGATTPVGAGAGTRIWSTATGCELVWDGAAWRIPAEGCVRALLGADYASSTVTQSDVTGLSFSVKSGVTYQFDFVVTWQCAATTASGIGLAINGPTTSMLWYFVDTPSSATARTLGNRRAYDTFGAVTTIDAANSNTGAIIRGSMTASADGTLVLRARAGTAGSLATVKAGSSATLRAMASDTQATVATADLRHTDLGTVTTSASVNAGTYASAAITLTNATTCALAFTSIPAAGKLYQCRFEITQSAAGTGLISYPSGTKHPGNTPPALSTTGSVRDVLILETRDGGTTWYSHLAAKGYV